MNDFDQAASAFYKGMVGKVPAQDYVGPYASEFVSMVRDELYPNFSPAENEEFLANLHNQNIPTDDPEQMWAGLLRATEESVVQEWAKKLNLTGDVTREHVNTAIQIQKNIQANLWPQTRIPL